VSKGVLGIGCSFTWGESLYYYSDLKNLPITEYHSFDESEVNKSMRAYKDKNRFIRKVADYYDTWDMVLSVNGGTNDSSFIYNVWSSFVNKDIYLDDFRLIVWQITSWDRSISRYIPIYDYDADILGKNSKNVDVQKYYKWRNELETNEVKSQLTFIDKMCNDFEKNGIKVLTIVWPENFYNQDLYVEKFKQRHVPIYYNNQIHNSFDKLLHNDSLTVSGDFKDKGIHKNDIHLNLKGQDVLFNSIIKKLKNDNFTI